MLAKCFIFMCDARVCVFCCGPDSTPDDLTGEKEKNKHLQEEMEATLHDIQNM